MAAGPSTIVASAESSTNRLAPGGSLTPPGNTSSLTLLRHSVDHALNNARTPFQNFTRRLVPRARASGNTQNAISLSLQHSWYA